MESLSQKLSTLPLADVVGKAVAAQVKRMPPRVEVADIESAAWLAYHRFMDGPGTAFEGDEKACRLYVVVRSAILERLRAADPLGRHTRRQVRKLTKVKAELERATGAEPSVGDLARAAGVREDIAKEALDAAKAEASESSMTHEDWIAPPDRPAEVLDEINAIGVGEALQDEINKLSSVAQHVIRRTVMGDTPICEVARELKSTHFKVVQIRDHALKRLRSSEVVKEMLP